MALRSSSQQFKEGTDENHIPDFGRALVISGSIVAAQTSTAPRIDGEGINWMFHHRPRASPAIRPMDMRPTRLIHPTLERRPAGPEG